MAASRGGAFHTGADFEAGRVHHVQQEERLDGVEPADAREDEHDERPPRAAATTHLGVCYTRVLHSVFFCCVSSALVALAAADDKCAR